MELGIGCGVDSQMACLWQPYPPIKGGYPLVNVYIAMAWKMAHRKFVDLPIENGDFPVRKL
jgi:hypothetical protein